MVDLLAKYATCPHCGQKIGFFNRIEHCAYSNELVCNKCIVSGRFSDGVIDDIPREYREKFRIFNLIPFILLIAAGFLMIQSGWYRFGGWTLYSLDVTLDGIYYLLGMILGGIIITLLTIRLPHLGTWMFYWWISKPENRRKVEAAVAAKAEGRYESENAIYRVKEKLFSWLKTSKFKAIHIIVIVLNLTMVVLFFTVREVADLQGTYVSAIAGVLWVITLIINFGEILLAAGFYSAKDPENNTNRRIIELFSWTYVWLFPLMLFSFVLGEIDRVGAMEELADEIAVYNLERLLPVFSVIFVVQALLLIGLSVFLMIKGQAKDELTEHFKERFSWDAKTTLYRVPKLVVTLLFFGLLLFAYAFCLLLVMVDPVMALGIVSPTYVLVGLFIPIIYSLLKLVPRRPKKYTQFFWTCAKISGVIIVVAASPAVLTPTWTNWSLEDQFEVAFGNDWEAKIPDDMRAKMRDVRYSAFENFFGFDISYEGDAIYNKIYCYDHPRWVRNASDGTILSDGSSKYTDMTQSFTFDAYLPPGLEFGDGNPEKLPVIIFTHGIGMEKGNGNANFSISRYFANQGYLVCDTMYGYTGYVDYGSTGKKRGYDFPDTVHHVANLTKHLKDNEDYYHADLQNVYFSGRSFGGWMAPILAYGHNMTFFSGNFSAGMRCRGVIPFYGAHGIADAGSDLLTLDILGEDGLDAVDIEAPYIRGSSNPEDPDYNPEWKYFNPYELAAMSDKGLCPTFLIHGTQDPLVPPGWDARLKSTLVENGRDAIVGFYPLGSHATDVIHWSHYGQSIIYYMERFFAITRSYA